MYLSALQHSELSFFQTVEYGKWRVDRVTYARPGSVKNFAVVIFVSGILQTVKTFVSKLIAVGKSRGMHY